MNHVKTLLLLSLIFLSGCHSYNDVKLSILDKETKEPLGDTYIIVDDIRRMFPTPFRQQKLYKTDSNGELIIDRDGDFHIKAIKAGYENSVKNANTHKNGDPTKNGFVPKCILMQKSAKIQSLFLEIYTINDYDYAPLTKEFIDYCLANNIIIYRGFTGRKFNLKDDR